MKTLPLGPLLGTASSSLGTRRPSAFLCYYSNSGQSGEDGGTRLCLRNQSDAGRNRDGVGMEGKDCVSSARSSFPESFCRNAWAGSVPYLEYFAAPPFYPRSTHLPFTRVHLPQQATKPSEICTHNFRGEPGCFMEWVKPNLFLVLPELLSLKSSWQWQVFV